MGGCSAATAECALGQGQTSPSRVSSSGECVQKTNQSRLYRKVRRSMILAFAVSWTSPAKNISSMIVGSLRPRRKR